MSNFLDGYKMDKLQQFIGDNKRTLSLVVLFLLVAGVPASLYGARLVHTYRSKAYSIDDPRNPCYPAGCVVLADGSVVKPIEGQPIKQGASVKCTDVATLDCTEVEQVKEKRWWNPFTWF